MAGRNGYRNGNGNGRMPQGAGKPAGTKSYSPRGTEGGSKGAMPGTTGRPKTGPDAVVAGTRDIAELIEPTHAPKVSVLDTNDNIGCGYGKISGKGNAY